VLYLVSYATAATACYYMSNYSKVEVIALCALPKDTTSGELAGFFPHCPFNAESQAGKL